MLQYAAADNLVDVLRLLLEDPRSHPTRNMLEDAIAMAANFNIDTSYLVQFQTRLRD